MLDDDGLPLDEVGPWARDKLARLGHAIDASGAARRTVTRAGGGASYIDLFCGSGRARVRGTGERIDGSPLVAYRRAREGGAPFSDIHLADVDGQTSGAAAVRIADAGGAALGYAGKADDTVAQIAGRLDPSALHFVYLDPFSLDDLPFSVFETLGRLQRIDLLVHIDAADLQQNLDAASPSAEGPLDRFAPGWRDVVDRGQTQAAMRAAIIAHWASRLEALGLPPARYAELVAGTAENRRSHWVVLVSRGDFADSLWNRIGHGPGQGGPSR